MFALLLPLPATTPEQDDGGLLGTAGGKVCRHAEGKGCQTDATDADEPVGHDRYQSADHAIGNAADRVRPSEPTAAADPVPGGRCDLPAALAAAAAAGRRPAAASFARYGARARHRIEAASHEAT